MEMEQLIDAQHEVHGRISRCVENLKKIKSAKVSMTPSTLLRVSWITSGTNSKSSTSSSKLSSGEKLRSMTTPKKTFRGDAEQLIRNLPATEDNFERAWDTLSSHFENTRFLVRSYLASFTSFPRIKAPSAGGLRRIVGALEGIGRPISDCSDLFVHLVVELLDSKTRWEWENSLGKSSAPPTYDKLREFLQEQLMTQEVLHTISPDSTSKGLEKPNRLTRASHVGSKRPDPNRSCPLCKKDHFIAYCDTYKKKTAQEKREIVGTHQRCWNCLGRHLLGECSSSKPRLA
ncbi:hypothetical protein RF55_20859 [Lasius niger]|uniref:Uncharacterized protein n=1 Tax=Lasius niger TaxID=67767 RepID=A0A0J7JZ31_LASNI|nr:hypothetical protein RF55_20859 [Lasius niger]